MQKKTYKNQRACANIMKQNTMCNACLILLKNMYLKLFYVLLYAFQTVLKTSDHLGSHSATPHKLKCALRGKLY
ncbi:hypothetical protein CJI49_07135 [Bifidobacteriaceae bacterium NR016]|nr:hypothetical protein CJI49_07135 [Bifidobacteriaceae bacterium NR016]